MVPSLLSDTVGASVKLTLATWWLSSWWVQGPTEGNLYSGRYSHSSSGELCGSHPLECSLIVLSLNAPVPCIHEQTLHFRSRGPFWTRGQPHHSDLAVCSTHTVDATHLLLQSAHTYPCRISELTAPPTSDTPGLILPSGYLVRHTSFRKRAQN